MARLFGRRSWPNYSLQDIIKRSRLLVIDDSVFVYLDLFKRDGYSIEKWDDVIELQKLETGYFDVILLDIQGVGRAQTSEQGLGILKHIKKTNPAQLVIAYSSSEYSLKYREFFDNADASLSKDEDYVKFKEEVDRLLAKRFSFDYYIQVIDSHSSQGQVDNSKLIRLSRKAIISGRTEKLSAFLESTKDYVKIAASLLQIVATALAAKSSFPA